LQLLQSEKLAAIGQLAAGIAHEINNPIGFINSNLSTLQTYWNDLTLVFNAIDGLTSNESFLPEAIEQLKQLQKAKNIDYLREDIPDLITESLEGLTRVKSIVLDLKNFSHAEENQWDLADLHKGLDSTLNIIWNELKYHCTIHKHYGEIPEIYCLPLQLNQVFMNLLINAGQAIQTQGDIHITTGVQGDNEVWVEITDTGEGISPELINRLCEPFFTTKPVGKGTGLGLSISQNIIKKHHGHMKISSQVGQGTTFRIVLPIRQAQTE
jgi:signal transduction histidine kinase